MRELDWTSGISSLCVIVPNSYHHPSLSLSGEFVSPFAIVLSGPTFTFYKFL